MPRRFECGAGNWNANDDSRAGKSGGAVAMGVSMLAWVQVLRKLPLTIAHPITGAIFVMVPLASHVLWNEPLPMRRVLGIAIIGAGIVVVARS